MIIGFIVETAVGLACICLGLFVWLGKKLSLLHEYHYKNVVKKDIPAYARLMGIGLIICGIGICAAGVVTLLDLNFWWVPLLAGFAAGIAVMGRAQKKYNGGWFG